MAEQKPKGLEPQMNGEFAALPQLYNKRFHLVPMILRAGITTSTTRPTTTMDCMVMNLYNVLPYLKLSCLFELARNRILLEQRYNHVIKITSSIDDIISQGTLRWFLWADIDLAHAKAITDMLKRNLIINSQGNSIHKVHSPTPILGHRDNGPEVSFPSGEPSQPDAEPLGHFQIKSQSPLHRNLLAKEPTDSQFVLPDQGIGGERADGHHNPSKTAYPLIAYIIA